MDGTSKSMVANTITQFHDIAGQLEAGSRFFDIRVYKKSGVLRAGHFARKDFAILGSYGPRFADVIQDVPRFLVKNRTETVVIKFSLSKSAKNDAIRLIESQWVNFLYDSVAPRALANVKLGDLRQKIIVVFDKPTGTMASKMHLVSKVTPPAASAVMPARSILWLQGDAPTANTIAKVFAKQNIKRAASRGAPLAPHLEMFYLTVTASTGDAIKGKACVAANTAREFGLTGVDRTAGARYRGDWEAWDDSAPKKVGDAIKWVGPGTGEPNIYMIDFVSSPVCTEILSLNGRERVAVAPPVVISSDDDVEEEEEVEEGEGED
jgi:hypothetical protein